jgi:hypothetical protein
MSGRRYSACGELYESLPLRRAKSSGAYGGLSCTSKSLRHDGNCKSVKTCGPFFFATEIGRVYSHTTIRKFQPRTDRSARRKSASLPAETPASERRREADNLTGPDKTTTADQSRKPQIPETTPKGVSVDFPLRAQLGRLRELHGEPSFPYCPLDATEPLTWRHVRAALGGTGVGETT